MCGKRGRAAMTTSNSAPHAAMGRRGTQWWHKLRPMRSAASDAIAVCILAEGKQKTVGRQRGCHGAGVRPYSARDLGATSLMQ